MRHIKKYNESKIDFQDLILLFAELSDDNLDVTRFGETQSLSRNIAIEVGEYFRSKPYLLKDIVNPGDEEHAKDASIVISYIEKNKPFNIAIQLDTNSKLDDTLKVLNFILSNVDQIRHFGYEMDDFFIRENQVIGGLKSSLFMIKYKSI